MARNRGSARRAPRHTGRDWERGYQFRQAPRFRLTFGRPFEGIRTTQQWAASPSFDSSYASLGSPRALTFLTSGMIRDGRITGFYGYTSKTLTAFESTLTGFTLVTNQGKSTWIIGPISGGLAAVPFDEDGTQGTTRSLVTANFGTSLGHATLYNTVMYWICRNGGAFMYKMVHAGGTITEVSGLPLSNMYYVFNHENNLVLIDTTGGSEPLRIAWSVDGSPEDFTGEGSGSSTRTELIAEPMGAAMLDRILYIGTKTGLERMIPTGTLPAFRFEKVKEVPGIFGGSPDCMASHAGRIYFIGKDGRMTSWSNGNIQKAAYPRKIYHSLILQVQYVAALDAIAMLTTGNTIHLFNPYSLEYIGQMGFTYGTRIADVAMPYSGGTGHAIVGASSSGVQRFGTDVSGTEDSQSDPVLAIGRHWLGNDTIVEYIELLFATDGAAADAITDITGGTLLLYNEHNSTSFETSLANIEINQYGNTLRLFVNQGGSAFGLHINGWSGKLDVRNALLGISVVAQGHNPPEDAVLMS